MSSGDAGLGRPEFVLSATRLQRLGCATLVIVLALLPHAPATNARFSYDDYEFVRNNDSLRSLASAASAWLRPFPPEQPERGLYRPLTALSYALDRAVAGASPQSHHVSSLSLYALCSLLVLLLGRRVTGSLAAATLAALIFALHPVHCEVVDSISGRSELLALSFSLTTLLLFLLRGRRRGLVIGAALLAYACALFSKETGVMTLAVLATCCVLEQRFDPAAVRRAWLSLWPFALITAGYLGLRALALEGRLTPLQTQVGASPFATRIWTLGRVLCEYARLLLAPVRLQPDAYYERTIGVQHQPGFDAALGLLLLAMLLGLLVLLGRALLRARDPMLETAFLGAAIFLWFLVPVSHLIPFGALMAERFLFAPSLGFAFGGAASVALLLRRLHGRGLRTMLHAGLGLWLLALGQRSHARAQDWEDNVTLFASTARLLPDDHRIHTNLARGYLERGDQARAVQALEQSLKHKPDHVPALNNLAFAHLKSGELDRAEQLLTRVVAIAPRSAVAWYNLATIAARRGELSTARAHYQRALHANPNYAQARRDLERVEPLLRRARQAVADHGPLHAQDDPARLQSLAAACRALGDQGCEVAAQQRLDAARAR